MLKKLSRVYSFIFARNIFFRFNQALYLLAIRGMGVLNYQDDYISGERGFIFNYLSSLTKPIVFDVGANIGNYSKKILAANPDASIYAFEPHPRTYLSLTSKIDSDNFRAFNVAVGDKDKKLLLYDYLDSDGSSHASLYKDVIEEIHNKKSISHEISVIKLEDFMLQNEIHHIDLLKIDTEGNELNVLNGLGNYLKNNKIKAIHFEFNEMNIVSNVSFKDFWDLLRDYDLYRLLPGERRLKINQYNPLLCEIYAYQNIIALLK